jgi:hypothetical protein
MGKSKVHKKLRKYAKYEALRNFEAVEYEASLLKLLRPKPKYLPWWLWAVIVKLVIKPQNGSKETKTKNWQDNQKEG